jgi:hypothetical protein
MKSMKVSSTRNTFLSPKVEEVYTDSYKSSAKTSDRADCNVSFSMPDLFKDNYSD